MALKPKGVLLLAGIMALAVLVGFLILPGFAGDALFQFVGALALYGYLFVVLTTLTNPFLKEMVQAFGKPFKEIHHTFAALGVVLITLHPITYAIQSLSLSVFVPNLESWTLFWTFAGIPAFYVFYVAFAAALLRRKALKYWKTFHVLMYVVLLLGIIHANLLGANFQNVGIAALYDALFAAAMIGLLLKRYQNYKILKVYRANHPKTPKPT